MWIQYYDFLVTSQIERCKYSCISIKVSPIYFVKPLCENVTQAINSKKEPLLKEMQM